MARLASAWLLALLAWPAGPPVVVASHQITGHVSDYSVVAGDTLARIGSRFGVDAATIAAANGLRAGAKLKAGQHIAIDNRHIVPAGQGAILINVPQRMLFLIEDGNATMAFPVALGRPTWPTPTGRFTVVTKEVDPTWDVPISIQREMARAGKRPLEKVPPGPENPLGDRWFGLSLTNIGIHGTNAPGSIYHHQTHGCIRLHPEDIRAIFDRVAQGAPGEIVYEPVLLAAADGRIFLEVHPDVYRRWPNALQLVRAAVDANGLAEAFDQEHAIEVIRQHAGIASDVTLGPYLTP